MAEITVQRVGDGVLATIDGATIHFESRGDAALFASAIMQAATLGADALDQPLSDD